jgi:hypothetical protein
LRFAIPQDESEVATAWFAEGGVGRMLATFRRSTGSTRNYLVAPNLATEDGGRDLIGA